MLRDVGPSFSRGHQTVTIMNLSLYCFYMPQLKTETRGEHLATLLWWVTVRLVVTCLNPFNPVNGCLIVRFRLSVGHGVLWPREVPHEKNMDLKSMQVNVSKSITRTTERGVDIRTAVVGRETVKQGGKGSFNFVVAFKTYH